MAGGEPALIYHFFSRQTSHNPGAASDIQHLLPAAKLGTIDEVRREVIPGT